MNESSRFWQAATVGTGLGVVATALLFGLVIGIADRGSRDPSPQSLATVVLTVLVIAAALFAVRRTPRTLGAAVGTATTALLLIYVWLLLAW